MIELKNVSKFYSNNGIVTLGLRNINLKLNKGEIVAITGDSGSGKSTLLNVITAVDTYEEGELLFKGNETSYFNQNDMDTFRKDHVSFIFQNYNIIDSYTVLENVMLPLLLSGKSQEQAKQEAKEIIERVGLSHRLHHKGTKLSGGEKQRCVIARALASDSEILACDEPTGNLDSKTGEEIIQLISEVAKDKLVLIVTHNYNQVAEIATRRLKIADGEIIEDVFLKETRENEVEEVLTLEEKKITKGTYFRIALQNIFSTPKKTIFSTIVFFVISFITLLLFLMMLQQSYETYSSTIPAYSLQDKERVVVYNLDHSPLKKEDLENTSHKEIYYNAFYEETTIFFKAENDIEEFYAKLTYHKLDYKVAIGKEPTQNDEYFIVLPNEYQVYQYRERLDEQIMVTTGSNSGEKFGTLVGVGIGTDIGQPYLLCYESYHPMLLEASKEAVQIDHYLYLDGEQYNLKRIYSSNSRLELPSSYQTRDVQMKHLLEGLYPLVIEYKTIYRDDIDEPLLYLDSSAIKNFSYDDKIYEAVIYTSNVKAVQKQLEEQGYIVSIPSDIRVEASMYNLAILYMFLALSIMALVCLFFISYIILARVYASKNKDYGVLRTLGMVKKQLGRIVILEVLATGLISSILAFIVFLIIYHTTKISMGDYMNFGIIVLYFVAVLIFSFFIAKRFNRRLYKFSANTTLKGEVARND
ncbi:MAG: ATP-binding cassette domain-containing protein [Anaeroplasmataceae bacterium]|nr:ATP-binding cassette domain-containing protein [Anaeroplasmataceae bacterium]